MAQRLDTVTPDIKNPDASDLDGAYLDEDVSVIGSPSLAGAANSQYYFFSNMMKKAKTAFNGLVDNSLVQQYFKALQINISGSEDAADWSSITTYNTAGVLVRDSDGEVYTATGVALNTDKNPGDPANVAFWYPCDTNILLRKQAKRGTVLGGEMHTIHDRSGANYAQNILVGKKTVDSIDYDQVLVHLDGTVLTGNTALEAIFDVGGPNEYPYLDLYAPDVVGTRTFVDKSGKTTRDMTVGGQADTLAEVQEDAMQRIVGSFVHSSMRFDGIINESGALSLSNGGGSGTGSGATSSATTVSFDSLGSISPNTAKTNNVETRMANLVVGTSYIIVMPLSA